MANTSIEWTDKVWNPTKGCKEISPACENCYAKFMAHRLTGMKHTAEKYEGTTKRTEGKRIQFTGRINFDKDALMLPCKWKKGRKIFINSMSDLFHENVSFDWIDEIMAVIAISPQHTFQLLTKRPQRMVEYFDTAGRANKIEEQIYLISPDSKDCYFGRNFSIPLNNLWIGCTVENQKTANERIPYLLATPACRRFLSCEPLLEAIDLTEIFDSFHDEGTMSYIYPLKGYRYTTQSLNHTSIAKIDWVIVGGESGRNARPMHPDWVRSLRDQCANSGTAFFFKQWGEWLPADAQRIYREKRNDFTDGTCMLKLGTSETGSTLDGVEHKEFPI